MSQTPNATAALPFGIHRHAHAWQVDHIGLGVPDTEAGVKWLSELCGVTIELREPEKGQWYWSGGLSIGGESFLEIIGPNPHYSGFQPFKTHLAGLKRPSLLFWYIAVDDFAALQTHARAGRIPIERVEHINANREDAASATYRRGFVGPGFLSQRPNVIEWEYRPKREAYDDRCKLKDFRLSHPKADTMNAAFEYLGIDIRAAKGASNIGITLSTPKGEVAFDNPGMAWTGAGALLSIARLWVKHFLKV